MTFSKLEYIWLDGNGITRSKTKIIKTNKIYGTTTNENPSLLSVSPLMHLIPQWNYDGSSTNQASGHDSEVILKPCVMYPDPFRKDNNEQHANLLILCETYKPDGTPHPTNTRHNATQIFSNSNDDSPMFGIEQEFFLTKNGKPIGVNDDNTTTHENHFYCGTGGEISGMARQYMEEVMDNCIYAGVNLTGINAEVSPSQWEFQVCATQIDAPDQLTMLRYIMQRTTEKYGWSVDYTPKLTGDVSSDWNGSGCHVNFSTKSMRQPGGLAFINSAISKLSLKHDVHMQAYGEGNDKRMTGKNETASYDVFTFGVANRGASIRIPRETEKNGCGYLEDRRPASNMDPYTVCSLIYKTTCVDK